MSNSNKTVDVSVLKYIYDELFSIYKKFIVDVNLLADYEGFAVRNNIGSFGFDKDDVVYYLVDSFSGHLEGFAYFLDEIKDNF